MKAAAFSLASMSEFIVGIVIVAIAIGVALEMVVRRRLAKYALLERRVWLRAALDSIDAGIATWIAH